MRSFLFIILTAVLLAAELTACGAESPPPPPTATVVSFLTQPEPSAAPQVEPEVAGAAASPTRPASSPTPSPEPTATNTAVPVNTPTQVPSPTLEPIPVVKINDTVTTAINVRAGPGTDYPVVSQFQPGQEARVTGRNEDTSWWQVSLDDAPDALGWVAGQLVTLSGDNGTIPVAAAPAPPPTAASAPQAEAQAEESSQEQPNPEEPQTPEELEGQLRCGQDFCVTYQAMVPIWENGGCIGNHSIFITVLQGPPPGTPLDGVVIGDTFNNVEVASGDKGPGTAEITLWSNTMSVKAKRSIDGTPYPSEESYAFTSQDELIPAEILAANGYCEGSVEKCRWAQQNNQVCRGHYSYKVTFHKFD
jgi:uncharacterized protein YraI